MTTDPAKAANPSPPRPVLRLLHRYVLAEVLSPTLLAFGLYTFIMLMNQLFVLADYAQRFGVPVSALGSLLLLQIPHIVVLTLPMALLVGFLVAAARLASDSELIALSASGVSFTALLRPVLHLALGFTLITGWLLYDYMPRSNHQLSRRLYEIFRDNVLGNVRAGEFNQRLMAGFTLFVSEVVTDEAQKEIWRGVLIEEPSRAEAGDRRRREVSFAREVRPRLDEKEQVLELVLSGVTVISWRPDGLGRYEMRAIDRYVKRLPPPPLARKLSEADSEGSGQVREKTVPELVTHLASLRADADFDTRLTRLEIHKRFAIPFACVVFAFLGLGLGATARNSGRAFGFVASLGIILVYYQLFYLGERLAVNGAVPPWLSMWAGNLLFGALGLWLFSRRARGRRFRLHQFLDRWFSQPGRWNRWMLNSSPERRPEAAPRPQSVRRHLLPILDRYVLSRFVGVLALVLIFAIVLYVQVTLFQLLDDILRNRVPFSAVLALYAAWMPEILTYVLPVSVLVATVIGFSLLTRTNEVTAMLVSGRSRHRIAIPVLCAGVALSLVDGWIFQHWLPPASARFDVLYDEIQGLPDRLPTSRAHWSHDAGARRFYHFAAYEPGAEKFHRLSVIDLDSTFSPLRHTYGSTALWSGEASLVLFDGWRRDFSSGKPDADADYRVLGANSGMSFPVTRDTFTRELQRPRYLSREELRQFTSEGRGLLPGAEARELFMELHARRAYPFQVLVMMLLGLPFAFAIGRRGSLYGVGVSIAIAAVYFTTVVVASHLGQLGLVTPALAAWSPNVLFGVIGLTAFLGLRT